MYIDELPFDEKTSDVRKSIAELLLKTGADINHRDTNGCTPFQWALAIVSLETIKWLLDHGADIKATTARGETALHFAAQGPHVDVIGFLLDHGFDIDCKCNEGLSPLHHVVSSGNSKGCELLLKRGAMVNCKSKTDVTPLIAAIKAPDNVDNEIVRLLLEYGADVTELPGGKSIIEIAEESHEFSDPIEDTMPLLLRHMLLMQYSGTRIKENDMKIIVSRWSSTGDI